MQSSGEQADHGEQPRLSAVYFIRYLLAALALAAAALAAMLLLVNRLDWWRGFLAASVVAVLSTVATIFPLLWALRGNAQRMVAGYFIATGVRLLVSLGGCGLAILAGGYPAAPTLLLLVPYYFVLLAVETAYVGRRLWSAKL
jgi:hypothetical protein